MTDDDILDALAESDPILVSPATYARIAAMVARIQAERARVAIGWAEQEPAPPNRHERRRLRSGRH